MQPKRYWFVCLSACVCVDVPTHKKSVRYARATDHVTDRFFMQDIKRGRLCDGNEWSGVKLVYIESRRPRA